MLNLEEETLRNQKLETVSSKVIRHRRRALDERTRLCEHSEVTLKARNFDKRTFESVLKLPDGISKDKCS